MRDEVISFVAEMRMKYELNVNRGDTKSFIDGIVGTLIVLPKYAVANSSGFHGHADVRCLGL